MGGYGSGRNLRPSSRPRTFAAFLSSLPDVPVTLEESRDVAIASAVLHCDWNLSQAAVRLGTDRRTLYRTLDRLGLDPAKERARALVAADEQKGKRNG